jgi:polyhydroxyalkanoate depolymerase
MLYQAFEAFSYGMTPIRAAARASLWMQDQFGGFGRMPLASSMLAALDMTANTRLTHVRRPFGIRQVMSGNRELAVREEVAVALPFGDLLHFVKEDVDVPQPKILVVAPLSGHFATLLRGTVQTLLRDHDVYITDWKNARDVPASAGRFGFEEYVDYVIRFLEVLGPRSHVLAVCQPCVQTLAAVAMMSEDNNPATPHSMTLLAGPVDVRINPTVVNELATNQTLDWFKKNLISRVPYRYAGAGRPVYPGFLQLYAFMSMNLERHGQQHRTLYQHLADSEFEAAAPIKEFYEEYFSVLDLTAEFYIETIDMVFQQALLAKGELKHRGRKVDLSKIRRTALLTVEGERDDICSVGQTAAAHDLCTGLRPHLKRHHLQAGVGHYGVFSGRKWDGQIYPAVRNMVLAAH